MTDGLPRHVVYVSEQLEDYRTVIKFCRQQPEFDPQRVILWGTSFAGTSLIGGHDVSHRRTDAGVGVSLQAAML